MPQVKCKHGHYYNDEIYASCPYCNDPDIHIYDDDNNDDKDFKQKKTVVKVIAILSVLMALISFGYIDSKENKLDETRQELQKKSQILKDNAENFSDAKRNLNLIKSVYGYGSKDFYSETPVVVLIADGYSKDIDIKCNYENESFIKLDAFTKSAFNSGLSKDIKAEWVNNKIRVTPGSTEGFNIIHVLSKDSNDSFDILVLVK